MIEENNVIVMDIDGTLCEKKPKNVDYIDLKPNEKVLKKLLEYKDSGYYIILYTSRNMRTHEGNIGKINSNTAKIIFEWLDKFNIPYDEIFFGKPWCGRNGFYVDDKAIRPSEFVNLSSEEIQNLLKREESL